jgi:hypothetical protein
MTAHEALAAIDRAKLRLAYAERALENVQLFEVANGSRIRNAEAAVVSAENDLRQAELRLDQACRMGRVLTISRYTS